MSTEKIRGARNTTGKDICIELPPHVNSNGYWCDKDDINPEGLLKNSLPELELQMIVVFCMSQTFHYILKRFGIPRLSSEIITGLLLAYALSDEKGNPVSDQLVSPAGQHILGTLVIFGYILFLFITAVKMNVGMVAKSGSKAATIGIVAVMVPFTLGMFTHTIVSRSLSEEDQDRIPFVFITQALVYFPVVATLLNDLNILNSELGRLCLSASMISDVLSFFIGNVFLMLRIFAESVRRGVVDIVAMIAYFLFVIFVCRPAMHVIIKKTPEGRPVKDMYVYSIIVLALATALYCGAFDEHVFIGPYILGLAIPDGPPLGSAIVAKLECFVSGVFLPLFVAASVLRVDFTKDKLDGLIKADIVIMLMMHLSKFVACLTTSAFYKMPRHDSWAVSLVMISKGIVEIAHYTYWRDSNRIDQKTYNILIYATLAMSMLIPVGVKYLYDPSRKYAGYQKRNIMHMKPNSELRLLICIHKPEDISATIDLLEASCATKENPIGVYVLHLIELIGRASPLFISHQSQKAALSNVPYSQNVILSFNRFENSNWGSIKVNAFTAVSPYKLMHEDICTLALDKLVSMVVLPFHRKWSSDGSVEVDDTMVRTLNASVLERSPCSVGILVNRGFAGKGTSGEGSGGGGEAYMYSVCLVFLGGKDDREALTLVKRMAAKEGGVSITVARFVGAEDEDEGEKDLSSSSGPRAVPWEAAVDAEAVKELKYGALNGSRKVNYVEEVVGDGSDFAEILKGMVDEYDLIIAGRTHPNGCRLMSGLDLAWAEFPELGVVGDLLASKDVYGKASVLVVQQQASN